MSYRPRKEIRVPVNGSIVYSVGFATQGGTVKDISMEGCLVESNRPPHPASLLSCRMLLPGENEPMEIQLALVQWVLGSHFGLKIVDLSPDTRKRLRRFLDDHYVQVARARRGRPRAEAASPVDSAPIVSRAPSETVAADPLVGGGPATPAPQAAIAVERLEEPVAILPRDLSCFVGWILDARRAFQEKEPLPAPPILEFEEFQACTQFIQSLLDEPQRSGARGAESGVDAQARPAETGPEAEGHEGARPERRGRVRRTVPRANRAAPPLSVRLAQLAAKIKLPHWFARLRSEGG